MALTEQRIVKQITFLPESRTFNVQWADQILRNGEVVSEAFHRKAYSEADKDSFLTEVDNAQALIAAVGW